MAVERASDGGGRAALPVEWRACCPERAVEFEREDDGRVTLLEPKFTGPLLGRWLQPKLRRPFIRTHLDEVGSAVWLACDGETSVSALAERLAERFGAEFDADHRRLTTFLQAMARRRLLRL